MDLRESTLLVREIPMNTEWQKTFGSRMRHFEERRPPQPGEVPVSIKVRVGSGCFHREHSPQACAY